MSIGRPSDGEQVRNLVWFFSMNGSEYLYLQRLVGTGANVTTYLDIYEVNITGGEIMLSKPIVVEGATNATPYMRWFPSPIRLAADTPDGGVPDGGVPDAGSGGSSQDAGTGGGSAGAGGQTPTSPAPAANGGCGCRLMGDHGRLRSAAGLAAMLTFVVALARRRRTRRRSRRDHAHIADGVG